MAADPRTGEKHVADVRRPDGAVIEFQHSKLSLGEMKSREAFYKPLVWVVDARAFDAHFTLISVVKQALQRLDGEREMEHHTLRTLARKRNQRASNGVDAAKTALAREQERKEKTQRKLEALQNWAADCTARVAKSAQGVLGDDVWLEPFPRVALDEATEQRVANLRDASKRHSECAALARQELANHSMAPRNTLAARVSVPVRYVTAETLPLVEIFDLSSGQRVRFSTLGLGILETKAAGYDILTDAATFSAILEKRAAAEEAAAKMAEGALIPIRADVESRIRRALSDEIGRQEVELTQATAALAQAKSQLEAAAGREESERYAASLELEEGTRALAARYEKQRGDIMRNHRGQYLLRRWKWAREVWLAATARVFFDTGADYLFEWLEEDLFSKIQKDDFVQGFLEASRAVAAR